MNPVTVDSRRGCFSNPEPTRVGPIPFRRPAAQQGSRGQVMAPPRALERQSPLLPHWFPELPPPQAGRTVRILRRLSVERADDAARLRAIERDFGIEWSRMSPFDRRQLERRWPVLRCFLRGLDVVAAGSISVYWLCPSERDRRWMGLLMGLMIDGGLPAVERCIRRNSANADFLGYAQTVSRRLPGPLHPSRRT